MHKIILDLFNIVAEFSLLLTGRPWNTTSKDSATHPNIDKIEESYKHFKEYSNFLYTGTQ